MTIYIDKDFRCFAEPGEGLEAVQTDFFDGKAPGYIEGYRFVPSGAVWTREDGVIFHGEMIVPWKDWLELEEAQRDYERQLITEYEQALSEIETALGVI